MRVTIHITRQMGILLGVSVATLVCIGLLFAILANANGNPVPRSIQDKANFKIVYPGSRKAPVDSDSFRYDDQRSTLNFKARFAGTSVAFTEQPAPSSLGADGQVYYPALGIHPYAQFKTNLGPVALTRFWQSGSLKAVGQAGVLATKGTLVVAHSDRNLTNQQWKDLFDNLKIAR